MRRTNVVIADEFLALAALVVPRAGRFESLTQQPSAAHGNDVAKLRQKRARLVRSCESFQRPRFSGDNAIRDALLAQAPCAIQVALWHWKYRAFTAVLPHKRDSTFASGESR